MKVIRPSSLPFNTAPLRSWAWEHERKRFDRVAIGLAGREGMTVPVAQTYTGLHGLGGQGRQ